MSFIGRFFTGAIACAVGLAAIYFGVDRLPASEGTAVAASDGGGAPISEAPPADPLASDKAQPKSEEPPPPPSEADDGAGANASLRINAAGLDIIKESEGLRLEAYQAGGVWYIGYGHSGASPGQKITEGEAEALLRKDVRASEDVVKNLIAVPVNANEFSAMVSLCYNLGSGNFGKSLVVSKLNDGDRKGAADAFRNHNKAGGAVNEHLTERREKERALFLTPA